MGQKTKKDKIIADLRRELKQTKQLNQKLRQQLDKPLPSEQPSSASDKRSQKQSMNITTYQYTRADLTKSLLLAILVISLEFILYWQLK